MNTISKKEKNIQIPHVVDPKSRALIWRQSAGILKGKIQNLNKKLRDIRKEWDRF